MILVKTDTISTVKDIGQIFGKPSFRQEKKILRFERILEKKFDFDALHEDLN